MLKVLFGEEQLQGCDVMLKDFAESKRINTRVHEVPYQYINMIITVHDE
jgi:hypothetical protein